MDLLLGVDGGNTKTVALVMRRDGAVIGAGRSGCSDMYGAGAAEPALAELRAAVDAALADAGADASAIAAAALSIAGADWPDDFALLEGAARASGYGRSVRVYNDAIGALRAGAPGGVGVVVACGTGAAIGARSPGGRIWHSSFWQEPGGAGHLGELAFRAVLRAELGIDPPTALTQRLLALSGAPDVEELLRRATSRTIAPGEWVDQRSFNRALLDLAADGDATARRLVLAHGEALGDYAIAAARQVGLLDSHFTLALAGGVFRHPSPLLADALVARVRAAAPGAAPARSELEPAAGALLLALEQVGAPADAELMAHLRATLPPPLFFET